MIKYFSIAVLCLAVNFSIGLAQALPLRIVHQKGQVTTFTPGDTFPKNSKIGYELKAPFRVFTPDFSELVLKHNEVIEWNLAGLTNLEFLEAQAEQQNCKLSKGHALLKLAENNLNPHLVQVPYGQIEWQTGITVIEVRHDSTALVYAEKNDLKLLHRRGQRKTLKEGEVIIIDRFGFKKTDLSTKSRVIFDFSRDEKQEKSIMKAEPQKPAEQKKQELKQSDKSKTVKGKVAKNAKIVEGEGDGEGEYKWDLGPNLMFFLIPIAILASIISYFKFRKPSNSQASNEGADKEEKEHDYEAEDIYVIRGNLTSNDNKLVTTKTTHILGNVEDGAEIEANHKILIKGSFQGAKLISTHSVNIEGGINGMSKANLQVTGDIKTTYISEANILCLGTVKVDQAIRNSKITSDGIIKVEKKDIIGGVVSSKSGIECETLGSDFGETEILLGEDPFEIWQNTFELKSELQHRGSLNAPELNYKAKVRVFSEVTNTKIQLGQHKLDQKKVLPGPVESHFELSDGGKLTFRGFRRGE